MTTAAAATGGAQKVPYKLRAGWAQCKTVLGKLPYFLFFRCGRKEREGEKGVSQALWADRLPALIYSKFAIIPLFHLFFAFFLPNTFYVRFFSMDPAALA